MYWERDGEGWVTTDLRPPRAVDRDAPVIHVDHDQAAAFAAGRASACRPSSSGRPPRGRGSERGNLDHAAFGCALAGAEGRPRRLRCRAMLGDVWEWTSSELPGYPGFEAFPYPEYSEVFFGTATGSCGAAPGRPVAT